MPQSAQDRVKEVIDCRDRSRDWMADAFYDEWEQVFQSYLCEREAETDPNEHGNVGGSPTIYDSYNRPVNGKKTTARTSIAMPDTWSTIRRLVARTTAQPPNLRFRSSDPDRASHVSRKIMRDWDKGTVQRQQKKHVTQAALFGWSVRAWYWEKTEYTRKRRIDPFDAANTAALWEQYRDDLLEMGAEEGAPVPALAVAALIERYGRGKFLPVEYKYRGYEGAKCEFLLVSDCFPEPKFTSIQTSNWFCVERKRNRDWLNDLFAAYGDQCPELQEGLNQLLRDFPRGSADTGSKKDDKDLRGRLEKVVDWAADDHTKDLDRNPAPEWRITERHIPGKRPRLAFVAEDSIWLGEIDYPYELDGKVAFTECVLIDSLLSGVGDSTARVLRGLQLLHDRQVNVRYDLAYNILRPLVGCADERIIRDPKMIRRHSGMRIVPMARQGDLWVVGEQSAMSAVAVGFQDESAIERQWQKGSGESNLSMAANVDPQQARTATGARIMAYVGDILTKDGIDMFTETCLKPDAEMIYLLNRSELAEDQEFDAAPYYRSYSSDQGVPETDIITVSPLDFQDDGEVEPEVGSTLADDDESKVTKAQSLFSMFAGNPTVNQERLRDHVLITMGEGRRLKEWAAQPAPPQPPELRSNVSFAVKLESLSETERVNLLEAAGILTPEQAAQTRQQIEAAVNGPKPPAGPPAMPPAPEEEVPIAAAAELAARGQSPIEGASTR